MDENVPTRSRSSPVRWVLAVTGLLCVVLAAVGAVLPVMPTTIFLIAAVACFARSSPRLEKKLLGSRLFAPYLPYVVGDAPLPRRARVTALVGMWSAVAVSFVVLAMRDERPVALLVVLVGLGVGGTITILRWRREGV